LEVKDAWEKGQSSRLIDDPHVRRVQEQLARGQELFSLRSDELETIRSELRRSALDFFRRHSRFYKQLFDHLNIDVQNASLSDLARLAIPSDLLRGIGQMGYLIENYEKGGSTFQSSGTSGKDPVKVYRSPLDLAHMQKATTDLFEHVRGCVYAQDKGTVLMMAAPEMRERMAFVSFVDLTVGKKGARLLYGMNLGKDEKGQVSWERMEANRENIIEFMRSRDEPKLLFAPPVVIDMLTKKFDAMGPVERLAQRLVTSAPPIEMGREGIVITAGGSKKAIGLPEYGAMVEMARRHFRAADGSGKAVPVPFMDLLGMAEGLTPMASMHGVHGKLPHPLADVFLLDPVTFEVMEEEGKEGILAMFSPMTTSWLECFYPGDLVRFKRSTRYYGKEFEHVRRLSAQEGWEMQRACGGSMEDMLRAGGPGQI